VIWMSFFRPLFGQDASVIGADADDAAPQIDFQGCKDRQHRFLAHFVQDFNGWERMAGGVGKVRQVEDDGIWGDLGRPPQQLLISQVVCVLNIHLVGPYREFLFDSVRKRENVRTPSRDDKHPPRLRKQIQPGPQRPDRVHPVRHIHHLSRAAGASLGIEQGQQPGVGKYVFSLPGQEITGPRRLGNDDANVAAGQLGAQQIGLVDPVLVAGSADQIQVFDKDVN